MKIERKYKFEYVACLPQNIETAIMTEVEKEVSTLFLSEEEKQEAIENANNSKVCDLEDTINIKYI